ncbi:hypothetical protein ALC56_11645 [Trachymyrmex septentrionalis]|uniref:Uncharacterized protein n=1 Tax=Trachymyrmex septentrionalis TaxID=34720 RepID=A0A151JTZ5_9HYME|nr:hypothetical protein ALC56_11645 [Trachymyrmex septentrionalis]
MQKEEAERERERAPRNSGRPPPPAGDEEDGREEGNRRRVDRRGPRKDRPQLGRSRPPPAHSRRWDRPTGRKRWRPLGETAFNNRVLTDMVLNSSYIETRQFLDDARNIVLDHIRDNL